MSNINFNSIYDGVTLALHAAFPKYKVHGGDVRQGLSTGDFNVVSRIVAMSFCEPRSWV